MALRVHEALVRVDKGHAEVYGKNLSLWQKRLTQKQKAWTVIAERIKGQKIAVYHSEYDYLARRLGLQVVASIESKPGVPPGPGDIAKVVQTMREQKVTVILTAAWSNNRQVADIAKKAGAQVVELPNQVGGAAWAKTWLDLMDGVHERLDAAFPAKQQ